jgi:fucokinase
MRVGSGGATLRILAALYGAHARAAEDVDLAPLQDIDAQQERILVIHSGGDSRRLPHCSATGKLFARIPHVLPDGRASTIFDEFLINLSGVPVTAPPGVLLVAGDVLLLFDHLQLSLRRAGVTGIAAAAPADMGTRHGVYLADPLIQEVKSFLHKVPMERLASAGAIDAQGQVAIDTGMVWFDAATAGRYAQLARDPAIANLCGFGEEQSTGKLGTPLNLYGDLLLPLAVQTKEDAYLVDASDGPPTTTLTTARATIWSKMRGTPLNVERLQPAVFVHFGTSAEYWRMVSATPDLAHVCAWTSQAAAWLTGSPASSPRLVAINAIVDGDSSPTGQDNSPLLVVDSRLSQGVHWQGKSLVAGVHTEHPLGLAGDLVVHQLPVQGGYVTRILGLNDDPKAVRLDARATFLNQPWQAWLDASHFTPDLLWPDLPPEEQSLWTAQLYPVTTDREESLQLALAIAAPDTASPYWAARWQALPRLSLAESFRRADSRRLLGELAGLEDAVAVHELYAGIDREVPADSLALRMAGWDPATVARRLGMVQAKLEQAPPLVQVRGFRTLALLDENTNGEDRAFGALAALIAAATPQRRPVRALVEAGATATASAAGDPVRGSVDSVRVAAAARIDFGGGWTDTPPYSIERGGAVLNAAITLHGRHPIVVEATWLPEPRLLLGGEIKGELYEPSTVGELTAYADPSDPFALVKAALVMVGLVPEDAPPGQTVRELMEQQGRGLRLATQTHIPRGSGLGTSSILAGAVLAALAHLMGDSLDQRTLFDQVLCLEQMLTTGGGWQDQVGGLVGGINLVTSTPGLPQELRVTPVQLDPSTAAALQQRLLLVYTSQQRLAKNLLRAVMGRWMARESEMVGLLQEIALLARHMETALYAGDLDAFGELLSDHWACNKHMDPGCTNPFIDELFTRMAPYISGAKLAGAGGGGFAIVMTREGEAPALAAALATHYAGTPVALWPCAVADQGLVV